VCSDRRKNIAAMKRLAHGFQEQAAVLDVVRLVLQNRGQHTIIGSNEKLAVR